jgi:hypothetical protein
MASSISGWSYFAACLFVVMAQAAFAQPIEGIIVEPVHTQPSTDGSDPVVTYRIFVDLAPDHALQVVFGEVGHSLRFETSTVFRNSEGGVIYAERLPSTGTAWTDALLHDSWFAMGKVGSGYVGIPRSMDTDGSVVECPSGVAASADHVCHKDGLLPTTDARSTINYFMEPGYLRDMPGALIETTDGAWAMLGGVKGATPDNIVLIAQLVTSGDLHFVLNIQVGLPDGSYVRVVAKDPVAGELFFEGLTYGKRPVY